ncbi:MAG: hypothetical protein HYS88_01075 [Candidatus Colwellbacteria bacterium]|nr:hypothetical protein [Candidatus Colwellbacteria bacterium]
MPNRSITLPDQNGILKSLLAVDEELRQFAPYLYPWAGETVRDHWKMVSIIETAIEQSVEANGGAPSRRGALVHYSPEIVEALCGKNGFAEAVKKDLKELLDHIGRR